MEDVYGSKKSGSSFELIASSDDDFGMGFGAGYKACKQCGNIQPYSAFRKEKKGVGGRKAICRACSSEPSSVPRVKVGNDRIQRALEAAAYRIIKESM